MRPSDHALLLSLLAVGCPVSDDSEDDSATQGAATTEADGSGGGGCADRSPPPVCEAAAERWVECVYGDVPAAVPVYAEMCVCFLEGAAEIGPECATALEDYYVCLSSAECSEILPVEHCDEEISVLDSICPQYSPS